MNIKHQIPQSLRLMPEVINLIYKIMSVERPGPDHSHHIYTGTEQESSNVKTQELCQLLYVHEITILTHCINKEPKKCISLYFYFARFL